MRRSATWRRPERTIADAALRRRPRARMSAASITVTRVDGTPASRCMAPAPASRPPNSSAVADDAPRVEPGQQRDRDRRVSVARRDVLVEGEGDARELRRHPPGRRARRSPGRRASSCAMTSIPPALVAALGLSPRRDQTESCRGTPKYPARHEADAERQQQARCAGVRHRRCGADGAASPIVEDWG